MAKIGEADPRWIVSERKDGQNVNNWHWEEKDLSKSVHEALKEKFHGLVLHSDAVYTIRVKEVSDISGDVTVAQRKGKIMCYFELKMTIKYGGSAAGSEDKVDGKITVTEVDHDNLDDDFELCVATSESNSHASKAEEIVRKRGRDVVRQTIRDFFKALYVRHSVGKNVPTKAGSSPPPAAAAAAATVTPPKPAVAPAAPSGPALLTWKLEWRVPVEELWNVLMNEQRASVYTRAPAKIDARTGGAFEFLGGIISGYFVEVVFGEKIAMQWRLSSWPAGLFSSVIITFSKEERNVTRMEFAQAGIPSGELDRVRQGWQVNFWDAIKMVFGFPMTDLEAE